MHFYLLLQTTALPTRAFSGNKAWKRPWYLVAKVSNASALKFREVRGGGSNLDFLFHRGSTIVNITLSDWLGEGKAN